MTKKYNTKPQKRNEKYSAIIPVNSTYSNTESPSQNVTTAPCQQNCFDNSISAEKYFESHFGYIKERIDECQKEIKDLQDKQLQITLTHKEYENLLEKINNLNSEINKIKQNSESWLEFKGKISCHIAWHWTVITALIIALIAFASRYFFFYLPEFHALDKEVAIVKSKIAKETVVQENQPKVSTETAQLPTQKK